MTTVNVRYIVENVDAAVAFYTRHLGFSLISSAAPAFADVARGDLRLLLSGPGSSAARPLPDGRRPLPGGWNRIHLIVDDLEAEVARLRAAGLSFRNDTSPDPAASRFCSTTRPATRSSSFSRPADGFLIRDRLARSSLTTASASRYEAVASVMVNRAPPRGPLSARTVPPCSSTRCFTMASPRPVPPGSRARDFSTR
jgi:catechol 2,3-dioxygenase-like lactoylglutathione lyase family enzyme